MSLTQWFEFPLKPYLPSFSSSQFRISKKIIAYSLVLPVCTKKLCLIFF
ncbi:hypothetical protein LEP1GSC061_4021 [Leptospira wolffii serovar Khorat str. Khorat-H2]|nr:hypothetical protein LEP1GSC061_4021 [Leptospira wolffii serovar Khorat str. Khorat-H2]